MSPRKLSIMIDDDDERVQGTPIIARNVNKKWNAETNRGEQVREANGLHGSRSFRNFDSNATDNPSNSAFSEAGCSSGPETHL